MPVTTASLVYFSPTHTTQRVLQAIARGLGLPMDREIDLTLPPATESPQATAVSGVTLIGVPVYGGRVAETACDRLARVQGNGNPAVVVAVYGNRHFDDALLELREIATEQGFRPIAAAAFVGEHSFSSAEWPIAVGRPDPDDLRAAEEFGRRIAARLAAAPHPAETADVVRIPGSFPYREPGIARNAAPAWIEADCNYCYDCGSVCPTGAIATGETEADPSLCIICGACIRKCPNGARRFEDPRVVGSMRWLNENCNVRREPELFL
jgi:ferredoxin